MTTMNVLGQSVRRDDGDVLDVRLQVRVGLRIVNGSALMAPSAADPNVYEPCGDHIAAWLSGGIIAAIDDLDIAAREQLIAEIRALAEQQAASYDEMS